MSENNGTLIRWPTFLLVVTIFIAVVGAMFSMLWTKGETRSEDITELMVGQARLEEKVDNLTANIDKFIGQYNGYK